MTGKLIGKLRVFERSHEDPRQRQYTPCRTSDEGELLLNPELALNLLDLPSTIPLYPVQRLSGALRHLRATAFALQKPASTSAGASNATCQRCLQVGSEQHKPFPLPVLDCLQGTHTNKAVSEQTMCYAERPLDLRVHQRSRVFLSTLAHATAAQSQGDTSLQPRRCSLPCQSDCRQQWSCLCWLAFQLTLLSRQGIRHVLLHLSPPCLRQHAHFPALQNKLTILSGPADSAVLHGPEPAAA